MDNDKLKICAKQCDQCLFSKNKIVSNKRKAEILKKCLEKDLFFICHKASAVDDEAVCAGFYNTPAYKGCGKMLRIATALKAIQFVDPVEFDDN